jgi:uncharacterized protein YggU (UPF0235/DUF167 family)
MRITLWVRPGSSRPRVGGERDGALVVQVSARPVDGQATEAALAAVAAAFGVRRRAVTLISGTASRTKVIEVDGADPDTLIRLKSRSLSRTYGGASRRLPRDFLFGALESRRYVGVHERGGARRTRDGIVGPFPQPLERLAVAERDRGLQARAGPHLGQVHHGIDQAGPDTRRDSPR